MAKNIKTPAVVPAKKSTKAKSAAAPGKVATKKPVARKVTPKAAKVAAPKPKTKVKAKKSSSRVAAKVKKQKTIRDSFNMPTGDYALIAALKKRALSMSMAAKKSELLRAGLRVLAGMADNVLATTLRGVPAIKTGRPGKKKS